MTPTTLDHAAIAARIPHAGAMCLLARAVRWDADSIECRATSHHDAMNPLRASDGLSSLHAVEYAAQAMALHGALLAAAQSDAAAARPGYIGAVRALRLHLPRLDTVAGDIEIRAERLAGDAQHVIYSFAVRGDGVVIADGRISVALGAAAT